MAAITEPERRRTILPEDVRSQATKPAQVAYDMLVLTSRCMRALVTPPFTWRQEFVEQAWMMLVRVSIPAAFTGFVFGYQAAGLQGTGITEVFGDITRMKSVIGSASLREQAIWNTGLVIAGAIGTALCADLGARKVRDELAALQVMGVDVVRKLVAPRVLAITLLAPCVSTLVVVTEYYGMMVAFGQFGGSSHLFGNVAAYSFAPIDVYAYIVRSLVLGWIIGIVCAYKGMYASGGARGVGRAVNQAVMIAFALVLIWDWASNSIYVPLFHAQTEI
jgi:phospholipid/cholesterol/gamma-HCH transport system permease protein